METLRPLLAGTPAGQALLEALEPHSGSSLPGLVLAVLQERAPAAPAAAAASEPPRASLEEAASVLKHLQFLTPRCAAGPASWAPRGTARRGAPCAGVTAC